MGQPGRVNDGCCRERLKLVSVSYKKPFRELYVFFAPDWIPSSADPNCLYYTTCIQLSHNLRTKKLCLWAKLGFYWNWKKTEGKQLRETYRYLKMNSRRDTRVSFYPFSLLLFFLPPGFQRERACAEQTLLLVVAFMCPESLHHDRTYLTRQSAL